MGIRPLSIGPRQVCSLGSEVRGWKDLARVRSCATDAVVHCRKYFVELCSQSVEFAGIMSRRRQDLHLIPLAVTMMNSRLYLTLYLIWSNALRLVWGEGYPLHQQDFVVKLTDETFEHETQASSGGTTGSWLIWFHRPIDNTPILGPVPDPEFWTDNHLVLATVDSKESPLTRARFHFNQRLPIFVLLHKGKYYKMTTPPKGYKHSWDTIANFATHEYVNFEQGEIPPPRTWMDNMKEYANKFLADLGGDYFLSMGYFFCAMLVMAFCQKLWDRYTLEQRKQRMERRKAKKD